MYQQANKRSAPSRRCGCRVYTSQMCLKASDAGRRLNAEQARAFVLEVLRLNTDRRVCVAQIEQVGEGLSQGRIRVALKALVAEGLAEVLPMNFQLCHLPGFRPAKYYRAVPQPDPGACTPSGG